MNPTETTLGLAPGEAEPDRPGGRVIADRYEDRGLLARGGMGEVRRVFDRRLQCIVAMKLLSWPLLDTPEASDRFLSEATLTAQLQHPGIVPVHDIGRAADGRVWYTMAEVQGRTLHEVILEAHRHRLGPGTLPRLVRLIHRLCEPIAFAHSRGVIHRDLKPSNLMTGPFGEALVMDWGLATRFGGADGGGALGTPAYAAPEQVRAEGPLTPAADVYALGGVLYAALCGRAPRAGSGSEIVRRLRAGQIEEPPPLPAELPVELTRICQAAMRLRPEERYPDAGALAVDLERWLDGQQRHEEAMAILTQADGLRTRIEADRARVVALQARATEVLGPLSPFAPAHEKARGWALQDEAELALREVLLGEAAWLAAIQSAMERAPDLGVAHELLADHYARQLLDASAERSALKGAVAEDMLARHDRGRYAPLLARARPLTVLTSPPGATVTLFRYVSRGRRLVPERILELGPSPIVEREAPVGSLLLQVSLPGHAEIRVPVQIDRGGVWDGVRPGSTEPAPLRLPEADRLGPDDQVVSAGWAWIGGDPQAPEALPRQRVWVDGFVMRRHPVTVAEYQELLDALVAEGRADEARRAAPLPGRSPHEPVVRVSMECINLYLKWYRGRTGLPWRLPDELEWEKAARGADGRFFVWGDQPEATWANLAGATASAPALAEVGGWPVDESVYGVRGLAGNARDWCANRWTVEGPPVVDGLLIPARLADDDPSLRSIRGGAWQSAMPLARAAARFASLPGRRPTPVGFRLVRDWPEAPLSSGRSATGTTRDPQYPGSGPSGR